MVCTSIASRVGAAGDVIRKSVGIIAILVGAYFVITFQAWGFRLIDWIGPERASCSKVQREPDGSVLMTNPTAMLFWCLPFLAFGIVTVVVGVKILRRRQAAG
jgi:hypothetical protein